MSVEITAQVWAHSTQKGNGLLLMVRLGDFADRDGFSFPSQDSLAQSVRCDPDTIGRLTKKAEKANELIVFRGKRLGNRYVIITGCDDQERQRRLELAIPKVGTRTLSGKMSGKPTASNPITGSGKKAGLSGTAIPDDPSSFDPSKDSPPVGGKPKAPKQRPEDPMFNAICVICGKDPHRLPKDLSGSLVGRVKRQLVEANWTANDVAQFGNYRRRVNKWPANLFTLVEDMADQAWQPKNSPPTRKPITPPTPEMTEGDRAAALAKLEELTNGHR